MTDIEGFIGLFQKYKGEQENQRKRGLNDFNIFTTLLNKSDEVRLHSRFLHFLLNPIADHSQGSLFLDLFLKECELIDFFENTEQCSVYKEHKFIDLYITDGKKHLIIENKIFAGDGPKQIQRYVDTIKKDNSEDVNLSDNLTVIYLSLDRDKPNDYSLGDFKLNKSWLVRGEEQYAFKAITYDTHIFRWIEKSHTQIENITNLSVGLAQYKDVILKLYGKYKDKVMNLDDFMEGKVDKKQVFKTLKEISSEYPKYRNSTMEKFFEKVISILKKDLTDNNWEVIDMPKLNTGAKDGFPLRIQQSKEKSPMILLGFEFTENDFGSPNWGVVRRNDSVDFNLLRENAEIKKLLNGVTGSLNDTNQWWLQHKVFFKGDFCEEVISYETIDVAAEEFSRNFLSIFNNYKEVIVKCNEFFLGGRITE